MGLLKNFIKGIGENKKEIKLKLKDAQQDKRIMEVLEERDKSANRRELERFYREKEEEMIKLKLDKIRKQKNKEMWSGKNSILKSEHSITKNDSPILRQKNIFKLKRKNMFLK